MLIIFLHLSILMLLMYIFARHEADLNWPKVIIVFAPLIVVLSLLSHYLGILTIPVYFIAIMMCLKSIFYVTTGQAATISASFVVYLILMSTLMMNVAPRSKTTRPSMKAHVADEAWKAIA